MWLSLTTVERLSFLSMLMVVMMMMIWPSRPLTLETTMSKSLPFMKEFSVRYGKLLMVPTWPVLCTPCRPRPVRVTYLSLPTIIGLPTTHTGMEALGRHRHPIKPCFTISWPKDWLDLANNRVRSEARGQSLSEHFFDEEDFSRFTPFWVYHALLVFGEPLKQIRAIHVPRN